MFESWAIKMTFHGFTIDFKNHQDYSKRSLWLPELMLKLIFMWPLQNAKSRKLFYIFSILCLLFVQCGLMSYSYKYFQDYNQTIISVAVLAPLIQTLFKMTMLQYHCTSLKTMIEDISIKFWPHDFFPQFSKTFGSKYHFGLILMMALSSTAFMFGIGFSLLPLLAQNRELPYKSIYPFDCLISPIYELLYILHCFIACYLINLSVLGFDFLFISICNNVLTQYILLKKCFKAYGDIERVRSYGRKFKQLSIQPHSVSNESDENKLFLVILIKHHQLLSRTAKSIENVVNIIAALQLCSSIVGICLSGLLSTSTGIGMIELGAMGVFLSGHLIQLFLYCSAGNELFYESSNLTDSIFASKWYEIEDFRLNKNIIIEMKNAQIPAKITAGKMFPLDYSTFIESSNLTDSIFASKWYEIEDFRLNKNIIIEMKNAQIPAKITAGKMFPLDYSTFIEVLRLTFSFYTLLSSLIEK